MDAPFSLPKDYMTTDAPKHNVPGCSGKIRHATRAQARSQANALHSKSGAKIDAYHCANCGGYHAGHTNRGRRK